MARIPLWGRYYWGRSLNFPISGTFLLCYINIGTGLLTVVGISFATLSTGFAIFNALYADGTCPSTTAADGTVTRGPCPDAYGMLLGKPH
jgi:uric acid-xanthine permease